MLWKAQRATITERRLSVNRSIRYFVIFFFFSAADWFREHPLVFFSTTHRLGHHPFVFVVALALVCADRLRGHPLNAALARFDRNSSLVFLVFGELITFIAAQGLYNPVSVKTSSRQPVDPLPGRPTHPSVSSPAPLLQGSLALVWCQDSR